MTNKLKYFVGNWKMFGDLNSLHIVRKIDTFCNKYKKYQKKYKVVICVPSTLIYYFTNKIKSKFISVGGQNCHESYRSGPFTGSITAGMLKNVGANYVIIGHSENRSDGDTNLKIRKKIESAIKEKLNIILCIGETGKEKKSGKTLSVLKKQLMNSFVNQNNGKKIIIAYEPRWSIGTGKTPNTSELTKIFFFIKKTLKNNFKVKKSNLVLYGGSVNSANINMFSSISEIDGFLVGGSSQSAKKFIDIIKNYYK
jgi:triosephosphate isomerase